MCFRVLPLISKLSLLPLVFVLTVAVSSRVTARAAFGQDKPLYPLGIAVDSAGDIYLSDRNLPGVWKIHEKEITRHYKGSKKFRTPLNAIWCVAFDGNGRLFAGDSSTRDVYRFDDGKPVALTQGEILIPFGIALNKRGQLLVSDLDWNTIWKVAPEGGKPDEFARIAAPTGVFVDKEDQLWVISRSLPQLWRIDPEGKKEAIVKDRVFQFPHAVALDDAGAAYVSDGYAKAIWKFAPGEAPKKWVEGDPLVNPVGIAFRGKELLVVDPRAKAVFEVSPDGKITTVVSWK